MFTPPGANNACHSHPARCKLRLHFRATIAASIVDYNLRSTLKTIVNRNDKQASDRVSAFSCLTSKGGPATISLGAGFLLTFFRKK